MKVFNQKGEFLFEFGSKGNSDAQFDGPTGITFDTSKNSKFFVVDKNNYRIQVFDK